MAGQRVTRRGEGCGLLQGIGPALPVNAFDFRVRLSNRILAQRIAIRLRAGYADQLVVVGFLLGRALLPGFALSGLADFQRRIPIGLDVERKYTSEDGEQDEFFLWAASFDDGLPRRPACAPSNHLTDLARESSHMQIGHGREACVSTIGCQP